MERITITEAYARLDAQGVSNRRNVAFKCPMCGTVQSLQSFLAVGIGELQAKKDVGFSCIGRFTGAEGPRAMPDGKPCNWTLGGLLRMHRLEIVFEDNSVEPHFEIATPEEAQALEAALASRGEAA